MRITLTGASGFLGTRLIARLQSGGHDLHVLGRKRPEVLAERNSFELWDAIKDEVPVAAIDAGDAIIHLAGEPVSQRWSDEVKVRIHESRVDGTRSMVTAIGKARERPRVLISSSAIGYYGSRGDEVLTEKSAPGKGFLPELSVEWEREADRATPLGLRVVKLRTGIVLGPEGGALKQMLPPFKLGAGGRLGSGRQWMSWIHAEDMIGLIVFALENKAMGGAVNATAPHPVRNADFTRALATALNRPAILPVPEFALKLLFGEMSEIMLASQNVQPRAALRHGYKFRFDKVDEALADAIS